MTTWAPAGHPWTLVAWRGDEPRYRVIRYAASREDAHVAESIYQIDHPEERFEILYRPCAAISCRSRLEY